MPYTNNYFLNKYRISFTHQPIKMSKLGQPLYQLYKYRFLRSWNFRHWKMHEKRLQYI